MLATVCASHLPPRAVAIPRPLSATAICRSACSLSLPDHRHDGIGMRLGAGLEAGMVDGAGFGQARTARRLPTSVGGGDADHPPTRSRIRITDLGP